jgi:hypothetical protein
MNITFQPPSGGFGNKTFLNHCQGIGQMQLKDMAPGFYIESDR